MNLALRFSKNEPKNLGEWEKRRHLFAEQKDLENIQFLLWRENVKGIKLPFSFISFQAFSFVGEQMHFYTTNLKRVIF